MGSWRLPGGQLARFSSLRKMRGVEASFPQQNENREQKKQCEMYITGFYSLILSFSDCWVMESSKD